MIIQDLKGYIKETFVLAGKSFYKTIEFQLLFKVFYFSILLFSINLIINTVFDAIDVIVIKLHIGETLQSIPVISLFEFKTIFILLTSLLAIAYIYLIEKNGVVIITSNYYRNDFSSSFKALLLAMLRTPLFILRRLSEMRSFIFIFIVLYITWKLLELFTIPHWIETTSTITLVAYGTGIFFAILFRYTFNAHITCLEPRESPQAFTAALPPHFIHKRILITILFYIFFILALFFWIVIFYAIIQVLLYFTTTYTEFTSLILSFFIAFTIVSITIFFSLFKTIKVSLMTVLYYKERVRQGNQVDIHTDTKRPLLSKSFSLAFLTIFVITLFGGAILTTTLQPKIEHVIHNAHVYNEQFENLQSIQNINVDDITLKNAIHQTTSNKKTVIQKVEKIVLSIFAYMIQ